MKTLNSKLLLAVTVLTFLIASCSSDTKSTSGGADSDISTISTDKIVEDANALGEKLFLEKYPKDSIIALEGEITTTATWNDKTDAKFGPSLNELPVKADFFFADNGGTKESTQEKVSIGKTIKFQGKLKFAWFDNATGKLKNIELTSCKTL